MSFKIKIQPGQHEFMVPPGLSVLEGALQAGIVLPYSCRDGGCGSCRGRVVSGTFEAGSRPAQLLSGQALSEGHTLFCQAKPSSDLVIESPEARLAGDMLPRRMLARVLELDRLAPDVMRLRLQLPRPPAAPLRFHAGQYLDVILPDGRRRSYSMAGLPDADNTVELHIRHLLGGVYTDYVFGAGQAAMAARALLRIEAPLGTLQLRPGSKPLIFLASGTGFAPIKALVELLIEQGGQRELSLYWGGRRPADLYMHELALSWERRLPGLRYVPVVSDAQAQDGWTGRSGLVHQAVLQDFSDLSGHEVYACGTPAMVRAARHDFTHLRGLPESAFLADAFLSQADLPGQEAAHAEPECRQA